MSTYRSLFMVVTIAAIASVGCQAAQKTMPHMGVGAISLEASLGRGDLVILDSVEGQSKVTSILGGLVQIIDDDKIKVLGIGFFTDKYTYFSDTKGFLAGILGIVGIRLVNPEDRAYYRALEKTPDADVVLVKSMDLEETSFGFLYSQRQVTFRGKAMKLKPDQ